MKEHNNPKKPIIYFYIITLVIVMLLNAFIFPAVVKQQISQVDYGTFLTQVESGKVKTVEIQDNQIAFTAIDEAGKENIYVTGRVDDPELVNRLLDADIEDFSRVIPRENSPLMNFIMSWVLPLIFFIGIGQLFAGSLQKNGR